MQCYGSCLLNRWHGQKKGALKTRLQTIVQHKGALKTRLQTIVQHKCLIKVASGLEVACQILLPHG